MSKVLESAVLNELQKATLDLMKTEASEDGTLSLPVISEYKKNVVAALERRGVLKKLSKTYKLTDRPAVLRSEIVRRNRTKKTTTSDTQSKEEANETSVAA